MRNKLYVHTKCSTCKKAIEFFNKKNIPFELIDILKNPPQFEEMLLALSETDKITKRLNTTGMAYKAIVDKNLFLQKPIEEIAKECIDQPMLIKRPFLVIRGKILSGFNEKEWEKIT